MTCSNDLVVILATVGVFNMYPILQMFIPPIRQMFHLPFMFLRTMRRGLGPPGLTGCKGTERIYDIKSCLLFVFGSLKVTWESALITTAKRDIYSLWNSLRGKGDLCTTSMFNKRRHFTETKKSVIISI